MPQDRSTLRQNRLSQERKRIINRRLLMRSSSFPQQELWVHRNKGTWRDIRPALIIFAHNLLLIGDSAGGFPSAFALTRLRHGRESTCSTICLTCQTKNSAMSSTSHPEVNCLKQRRVQRLPSAKKLDKSSQCQSGYVAANLFVRRTETSRGFIERAQAGATE